MLHVVAHVPVEEPENGIHIDGAADSGGGPDVFGEAGVLGEAEKQPSTMHRKTKASRI